MSPNPLAIIQRVYDEVHAALWALLGAAVLFFLVVVLPTLPANLAEVERRHAADVAAENRHYCEKWGMAAGTQRYMQCMHDLGELRAKITRRMAEQSTF